MMIFSRMFNFMNSRMDEFIEDQKDIKLILDEQLLLQDLVMPQQQYKLLNYLKDHPQYIDTLIEYITDLNEDTVQTRAQYKYPFLSSEVLSKENDFFQDFLFEEQNLHYLNRLFTILNEDILNITQASYFSKIILTLLRKKPSKMVAYLSQKNISNLLKHLDISHIAEVVEKIIVLDPNNDCQDNVKQKDILQRVMKIALHRYYEIDIFDNCMQIINNLIKSPLTAYNQELIELIINPYFFLTICYQSQRPMAYELVSTLLQYINNTGKFDLYINFIDVAKHLPSAISTQNLFAVPHQTTYGQIVTPFAPNQLILLQIYYLLLLSEREEIIQEFASNQSFQIITQLILSHQFNNQALIWFEKIVIFIFQKLPNLFLSIESFLAHIIVQYNKNEKQQFGTLKQHIRPGYQGILTKISNLLIKSNYGSEEWDEYANQTLKTINEVEKRLLCDVDPKQRQMPVAEQIVEEPIIQPSSNEGNSQEVVEEDYGDEDNNKENENDYPGDYEEDDKVEKLQIEEQDQDQEDKFYDCNEEGLQQQLEEQQKQNVQLQELHQEKQQEDIQEKSEEKQEEQQNNEQQENQEQEIQQENHVKHHKQSAEEQELIEEQIEEIIADPSTSVEEVAQLIQTEEKLAEDEDIEQLEKKQDHQVNEYFKNHEEHTEE